MGRFRVPQFWIVHHHLLHPHLLGSRGGDATERLCLVIYLLPVGSEDLQSQLRRPRLTLIGVLYTYGNKLILPGGDIERMALQIQVLCRGYEFHRTEQTATSIPTRTVGFTCVGTHCQHIVLPKAQLTSHIHLETHVAIVCTANVLAVQIDIAYIHDAAKINEQPLSLQAFIGRQVQPVPATTHLLETTARESALDVGCHIRIVRAFRGVRLHPRLFYLEIMGQIYCTPCRVVCPYGSSILHIAFHKAPTEIQVSHTTRTVLLCPA